MMECSLVYMTMPDEAEAERIGTVLIERQLAACVNLLPAMRSMYRWQGKVESAAEVVLLAKTRSELVGRLSTVVSELHPYECPCVISVPITNGYAPFVDWIIDETKNAK